VPTISSAFAPQDFQCPKRAKEPAMNTTIENIPTVWHDQAGFPDDTALMATAVFAGADLTAHIEKVLDDLARRSLGNRWPCAPLPAQHHTAPH
jgi:3-hydroxyacyl-CoA dehydrogenase